MSFRESAENEPGKTVNDIDYLCPEEVLGKLEKPQPHCCAKFIQTKF